MTEESDALTMVDVAMAGSLEEYEFSGAIREDVELEHKSIAEVEVEDGELPEEGEICDDEDAEGCSCRCLLEFKLYNYCDG